jgi:hypothetical protein
MFAGQVIVGVGLMVTVAVIGAPTQPFAVGVIVKVTVTGAVVVFTSVPLILLPVPLAAIPVAVAVLFLVHANVVPDTPLVNAIAVIGVPVHTVCDAGVATATGIGFTVTGTVTAGPLQPFAAGVMVNVVVTGAVVVFVNVPLIGVPVPLAAIPVTVAVLFLVQLNVVPGIDPTRLIGVIAEPEQIVCGERFDPQPLIPFTVSEPELAQLNALNGPLIHPDATTLPLHLTSHSAPLSPKKPSAVIKKLNGAFVAGTVADGVAGGLKP